MKNSKTKNAIKVLVGSKKVILSRLRQVVKTGSFNYRTFGTAIEEYISDILIEIFKKADFVENDKDYILAPNKNYFPDFQLKTSPILAIEYKSGNVTKEITDIQIAPFYKFIGLNRVGLLSYREKDGNLRPKDLFGESQITSFEQFNRLFKKTIIYRSKRIIKKHRLILKSLRSKK